MISALEAAGPAILLLLLLLPSYCLNNNTRSGQQTPSWNSTDAVASVVMLHS
jgi:hypothetical protein